MQESCFTKIEEVATRHWFFQGRAALVAETLGRQGRALRVLDVGCGTGYLSARLLADGHAVTGVEPDDAARALAAQRLPEVVAARAEALPFPDASFDTVVATDVLEHVADDAAAVTEFRRVLKPGGWLVLTVPAWMFLWGPQDVSLGHHRRYRPAMLRRLFVDWRIRQLSFFLFFVFPAVFVVRRIFRVFPGLLAERDEVGLTPRLIDPLLRGLLAIERWGIRHGLGWPIGVSLFAVVEKQ